MNTTPRLDQYSDFGDMERDELDVTGVEAFVEAHPNFYQSQRNAQMMVTWCRRHGVPTTRANLECAFGELRAEGLLEIPQKKQPRTWQRSGRQRADVMVQALATSAGGLTTLGLKDHRETSLHDDLTVGYEKSPLPSE